MESDGIPRIREEVLRDPRYPVHQIADKLLPYLRVLVDQFHPEQVILFGSYAYGQPTEDSDVDLLVVKRVEMSPVRDGAAIRAAWWPLLRAGPRFSFDLMVRDPEDLRSRLESSAPYYEEVTRKGLRVA